MRLMQMYSARRTDDASGKICSASSKIYQKAEGQEAERTISQDVLLQ